MLNRKLLRNELKIVAKKLALKGYKLDINKLNDLEDRRKILQVEMENLQARHNLKSKNIGITKTSNQDIKRLCLEAKELSLILDKTKIELDSLLKEIHDILLDIPNLPDNSVPIGKNKTDNIEIKRWGIPRKFNFPIKDHVSLGKMHDGLDFDSAVKMAGPRFVIMKKGIARLHRALIQFMLDLHIEEHSYIETYMPYLVNKNALYGTGHLPKFTNDLFHTGIFSKNNQFIHYNSVYTLIPTAEVPLTNIVRDTILNERDLPIKLIAHSPCFRLEAGSYGRNVRGMIRMHQFDKVELVQIVNPETSMQALEDITCHAEKVLELLDLPYRRLELCTYDISFSSCKTYDLEVWIPGQNNYIEVSSCSNAWDFQARRMNIRYRSKVNKKNKLAHTLNGSGLAVGRTLIAVLENNQEADGRIKIPEVLRIYMKGQKYID